MRFCCRVHDPNAGEWLRFDLWPEQERVARELTQHSLSIVLKARQLGLTWICVALALHACTFQPSSSVLLFSKRDDEAEYMLDQRFGGMYDRLPGGIKVDLVRPTNKHQYRFANGSSAMAFPTTGGRSYTASLAIVDEADFVDDLDELLNAVKPTIDAGGRLILVSTADKAKPESAFKRIFRGAQNGDNQYHGIFLPWHARPGRDAEWYARQRSDVLARTGALDDLYQEYPATPAEALAARSLDKRFPAEWLARCDATGRPGCDAGPGIPGLLVFDEPAEGRVYVIGADPAEGNPQSDESCAVVLDAISGEQVAVLGGRSDPSVFGSYVSELAEYYGGASVLVERNNHGHAVILWLRDNSGATVIYGLDRKPGWPTTGASKPVLMSEAADAFRQGECVIRDFETLHQLQSIEGATLKAPENMHDDRAMAFVLALKARQYASIEYMRIG
jgi:hypothetical protein